MYLFIVVIEVNHIIYIEGERNLKQKPNFRVKIPKVYIHTTIQHNLWDKMKQTIHLYFYYTHNRKNALTFLQVHEFCYGNFFWTYNYLPHNDNINYIQNHPKFFLSQCQAY